MKEIKILKIEETSEETDMYDLEVEDNHNFILENKLITHNSGKTCFSFWLAEQIHKLTPWMKISYVGIKIQNGLLPEWCLNYEKLNDVPNHSFTIIDEMAIQFNARNFKDQKNIQLGQLLAIARHKDLSVIMIAQDPRMSEINAWRLRDMVIYKRSNTFELPDRDGSKGGALLQFWRYVKQWLKPTRQEQALFEYQAENKVMLFKYDIPDCWSEQLSKAFNMVKFIQKKEEPKPLKISYTKYRTAGGVS